MKPDLRPRRKVIMAAQAQLPVQPKDRRQRARNQPQIVEIRVQERTGEMRLDAPAIQGVRRTSPDKGRVTNITKPPHGSQKRQHENAGNSGNRQLENNYL